MFIKLHCGGGSKYINSKKIQYFISSPDGTEIYFYRTYVVVQETPEEIIKLLQKDKNENNRT